MVRCFIMLCLSSTERKCIQDQIFGEKKHHLDPLSSIRKGDAGFLYNMSTDELLGIFVAEDKAKLNIMAESWWRTYPAQVPVKIIGKLQRVSNASKKLSRLVNFSQRAFGKIPTEKTYGPSVTAQIISLFDTSIDIGCLGTESNPEANLPLCEKYDEETQKNKSWATKDVVTEYRDIKNFTWQQISAPFEDINLIEKLGLKLGSGMLFFGPRGVGKILLAIQIAKSLNASLVAINTSPIKEDPTNAEKILEEKFAELFRKSRAVLFLDRAELILSNQNDQLSTIMQQIVRSILTQMEEILNKQNQILVIAATNKPEMVDLKFFLPGRLDRGLYVKLPDLEARMRIIRLSLRKKWSTLSAFEIRTVAKYLENYSEAEINQIIDEAAFRAFQSRKGFQVLINIADILQVIDEIIPSVRQNDIGTIEQWTKDNLMQTCG